MTTIFRHVATGLLSLLVLGAFPCPVVRAEEKKPPSQEELDKLLRKLEKDIADIRGLAFKAPVVAKIIPRPADAAKKLQGYYSIKDKTLFVYDDLSGAYERGVLIHEMVHALQDQHFSLKKLHETKYGSDAELALAALIEGDATFTMIEVLKKDQPRVSAMLDTSLDKAQNLQNAFLYAQGARYVKARKDKGGWEAVNNAYRFHPASTAVILHPTEKVSTIDLGPGEVVGEYGIISLLRGQPETTALALGAATGWRGDRTIHFEQGKAWTVAFASREQAGRFQKALANLHLAQNKDLKRLPADADARVWETAEKGILAVLLRGSRVVAIEAAEAAYKKILEQVDGPPALEIHSIKDKRTITFGELTDRLLGADVICVGETHDSDLHHRVQFQIIKALYARDERLGVGMEMFQRPYQKEIDRYFKGEIAEEEFLKAAEYQDRWGFDWSLYRPITEFCRKNGLPLAALNVPRELTRKLSRSGFAGLTEDEKKQFGSIDFNVPEHRKYWYDRLGKLHGNTKQTEEDKERGYQVMTAWDDYMAASAAAFQHDHQLRRLVVLAGSGHIDRGFGIPNRTVKRTGGKAATVKIEVNGDLQKLAAEGAADFIIVVR
jgi:uncharacterized iron-regulated protein